MRPIVIIRDDRAYRVDLPSKPVEDPIHHFQSYLHSIGPLPPSREDLLVHMTREEFESFKEYQASKK